MGSELAKLSMDEIEEASALLKNCLDLFEAVGDKNSLEYVSALQNFALAELDAARRLFLLEKCTKLAESLGLQQTKAFCLMKANLLEASRAFAME